MQDRPDRDHLEVTVDGFHLPNLCGEQPRSRGVIEEIGFGELFRIFQDIGDQRQRHADAG